MELLTQLSEIQVSVIVITISVLTYKLIKKLSSDENSPPPGPWGFPILGYLPLLGKEPNVTFVKLREKYGDIFQIQMGSWTAVVVNGKHAITEALKNSGDDFSGRPQFVSSKILGHGESLSFGQYNEEWKILRKLSSKVLFDFSNAKKNPVQDMVQEEVNILVRCFTSQNNKDFDPREFIYLSSASIIYQICYGREQNVRDSKDFEALLKNIGKFTKFVRAGNHIDLLPWLQYFVPRKLENFLKVIKTRRAFRNRRVDEHRENFSSDHLRDITDGFLAATKMDTGLTEERILATIDGFFGAAFETVTSTLRWMVLLMAAHPDVQKRVQAEIDQVVGDGRRPGIQDRGQLVYTEAVLHEINRYTAIVPLSLPHSTTRDTQLEGYSIKKDTIVYINLFSMSRDKAVWGDPDVFRPERFLDDEGQIRKSLLEEFLPFSTGGRKCMGESLARIELFLFFSGLLQRCSITKPPHVSGYSMDIQFGLHRECLPHNIQVQIRD